MSYAFYIKMLKILPLLILISGIAVGVYLIGQRTNILPKAQEEPGLCKDNPISPPSPPANGSNFTYFWEADCESETSRLCKKNSDCPQNLDDPLVNPETSNWCYGFLEGPRCMQLITKRGQTPTEKRLDKMEGYKEKLDKFLSIDDPKTKKGYNIALSIFEDGINKGEACLENLSDECKAEVKELFGKAKTSYRLLKYYAILAKYPSLCAEADLGMKPRLLGTSSDQYKEGRRLFMCSGSDGSLKWRVKAKDETGIIRAVEDFSQDLNSLPNQNQVMEAERLIGI